MPSLTSVTAKICCAGPFDCATAMVLPRQVQRLLDAGGAGGQQPRAAGMGAGDQPHIEPLIHWLQPAKQEAGADIDLAGGDVFGKRIVAVGEEVDQLDVNAMLGEHAGLCRVGQGAWQAAGCAQPSRTFCRSAERTIAGLARTRRVCRQARRHRRCPAPFGGTPYSFWTSRWSRSHLPFQYQYQISLLFRHDRLLASRFRLGHQKVT